MTKVVKLKDNNSDIYLDGNTVYYDSDKLPNKVLMKPILLWENEEPTAEFEAQTISLNSDDWDMCEIYYYDASDRMAILCQKSFVNKKCILITVWTGSGTSTLMRQVLSITSSSIQFFNGYKDGTVNNLCCIPQYVIGYKTGLL